MYHAFPRHLSRTCLVFVDKFILRALLMILRAVLKGLPFLAYAGDVTRVFSEDVGNGD
jgi:hypothetical protein